jgi:RNA 3'-terminal phosphate cyclase (ATP)
LPLHIAERECSTIESSPGWKKVKYRIEENNNSFSPGNVVTIELGFENITEVVTALGKQGTPAQKVAKTAVRDANEYLESNAVVGDYLADQLMLPMAIAAQQHDCVYQYRTVKPSDHSTTHAALIRQFLDVEVAIEEREFDDFLVKIHRLRQS